jgi:hypothetical protein
MTAIITRTDTLASDNGSSSVKGSTLTWTELDRNFYPIKLTTDGTAEAGKALILDANKDFTGVRNGTLTGTLTAGTLTDGTVSITGGAISGTTQIGEIYISSAQTLSTSKITIAHSLSGTPNQVVLFLQCTTANGQYSVGDRLWVSPNMNDNDEGSGTSNNGFMVAADSTNLYFRREGSSIKVNNKNSGELNLNTSSWRAYLVARYYA